MASNIFQKCYSLPKPEAHELQKLRVIETEGKLIETNTVSHFSYAPHFQGLHFFTKMLEANIFYENLLIDILSA